MKSREVEAIEDPKTVERFDVFISHADTDRKWVEVELLPKLSGVNLQPLVGFLHFQPGARMISELETAIQSCPKTILVISPEYLKYEWALLDRMEVLDPFKELLKFIPIVIASCVLPIHIKSLVFLDFTTKDENKLFSEWNRLTRTLLQSQEKNGKEPIPKDLQQIRLWSKAYDDIFLQKIEERLRMEDAHWIQAGFSIPSDQFSFAAVFFENQIEILERLEEELNFRCQNLDRKQLNLASPIARKDLDTILNLIKMRTRQLKEIVGENAENQLDITIRMALKRLLDNIEALQSGVTKLKIDGVLQSKTREKLLIEFRSEIYAVLFSLHEVLKYSKQIKTLAEKEWSYSSRPE